MSRPEQNESVTVDYYSTQDAVEKQLSGEVIETTATPRGWSATIAGYNGVKYKLISEGKASIVKTTDKNGRFFRIGFCEVDE